MECFLKKYKTWKTVSIFSPINVAHWPNPPNVCFCKQSFIGTQPHVNFPAVLATYALQQQSWVAAPEAVWLFIPKILIIGHFTEIVCWHLYLD